MGAEAEERDEEQGAAVAEEGVRVEGEVNRRGVAAVRDRCKEEEKLGDVRVDSLCWETSLLENHMEEGEAWLGEEGGGGELVEEEEMAEEAEGEVEEEEVEEEEELLDEVEEEVEKEVEDEEAKDEEDEEDNVEEEAKEGDEEEEGEMRAGEEVEGEVSE
mmetsp:Transcript_17089/g.26679  ORF Transcript_17089/g.26679 Transcript_17089/m.26679 type:complete len:160 (+) Transcript_17089:97-576(+)